MARVSQEQAAENRARVVSAASTLFRRKGLDGVAIAEVMAEAGLTHGGFYGQFESKDVLAGEACGHAFEAAERTWDKVLQGGAADRLRRLAEFYLKPKRAGHGCPMATLAGDTARTPVGSPIRKAFTAGLRRLATVVKGDPPNDRALALLAALVGAAVLQQACDDKSLAQAIDAAVLRLATVDETSVRRPAANRADEEA